MPQLKAYVSRAEDDFDDEFNTVVFVTRVPPMPVLQFEVGQRKTAKVGFDFTDDAAC
jgi:hypothetical protein